MSDSKEKAAELRKKAEDLFKRERKAIHGTIGILLTGWGLYCIYPPLFILFAGVVFLVSPNPGEEPAQEQPQGHAIPIPAHIPPEVFVRAAVALAEQMSAGDPAQAQLPFTFTRDDEAERAIGEAAEKAADEEAQRAVNSIRGMKCR